MGAKGHSNEHQLALLRRTSLAISCFIAAATPLRLQASAAIASDPSHSPFFNSPPRQHISLLVPATNPSVMVLSMRRVATALVVLAAVVTTLTNAQFTFASIPKLHSQDSRRSAPDATTGSTERNVKTQAAVKEGGYSFDDLPVSSKNGGYAQRPPASPAPTTLTADMSGGTNNTVVKSLGKTQVAGKPVPPKPSDDTDPTQSELETPSKTLTGASLGESQVAGRPVKATPTPAPTLSYDDDDEDDDSESEDGDIEESDDGTDEASIPKQSDV